MSENGGTLPPVVSVVIPTYNHARFIGETLASVFAQTFGDVEVIVINDGSPDDTEEVLRPMTTGAGAAGKRITYVRQENRGQAAARNTGLKLARGEFVALLDDDDVWPLDKLAWQVAALRKDAGTALAYGFARSFGGAMDELGDGWPRAGSAPVGQVRDDFLRQNWIVSPGQTLIRRSMLQAIGGLDETVWGADDWDLYLRLAERGTFLFEDRVALRYRFHGANASKNFYRMYQNCRKVIDRQGSDLRTASARAAWRAGRAWVSGHYLGLCMEQAKSHAKNGDGRAAARVWRKVIAGRPDYLFRRSKVRSLLETWRLYRAARTAV